MTTALLFLIPIMSWLDRQRGCHECPMPKIAALALLGLCVAALTGHLWPTGPTNWQSPILIAGTMTAWSVGWGQPIGWALTGQGARPFELWQVGILRKNPWVALVARGLMMALPGILILDMRTTLELAAAFGISFPLAPMLAVAVSKTGQGSWATQEYLRGGIAGVILWFI